MNLKDIKECVYRGMLAQQGLDPTVDSDIPPKQNKKVTVICIVIIIVGILGLIILDSYY